MKTFKEREAYCFDRDGSLSCNVLYFDPQICECVLKILYEPHIRRLADFAVDSSEDTSSHAALNDPTLWTKQLEQIIRFDIDSSCLSSGLKERYDKGEFANPHNVNGPASEIVWIELVRWFDNYRAHHFDGDPTFPHHLLANGKLTKKLSARSAMALLITVCLADVEQLLQAYHHLYWQEPENRFLQLMTIPHDLVIDWYSAKSSLRFGHQYIGLHSTRLLELHKKNVAEGLNLPLKHLSELASKEASEELDAFVNQYSELEAIKQRIVLSFAKKHAVAEWIEPACIVSFYTLFEASRGNQSAEGMRTKIKTTVDKLRSLRALHSELSQEIAASKKGSLIIDRPPMVRDANDIDEPTRQITVNTSYMQALEEKEQITRAQLDEAKSQLMLLTKSRNFDHRYFLEYGNAQAPSNISPEDSEAND
jgi:hypothetical protein